ncbi:ABC transporter ATP-binding protein [Allokutzneria albata]|uniref:ABC-type multidrug transport system, ATPase component n=1 Tax=Allokutzneria albata TaxID=211114 RepID=A0A1G9TI95_ALLAB|nr:ABC transporter ATP-binding protein [Allokutzneria albata]SDM47342.1 ABC-type multidrug transport system, ATPase component [Allokutzneria albata]
MPQVDLHELSFRYRRRTVIDRLTLGFDTGVHGLLGPNGAGKTTLMRVLATVNRPSSGRLTVLGDPLGTDAGLRSVRRRLGYLPQTFGFYPRFTVREFVEYFAWLKEVPRGLVNAEVDNAIDRVGLGDRADDKLKTLSGGMLRRVGVAQAIVNSPQVLLLDEPTTGLDPEQRMDFRELLRDIGKDNCVIVSTHLIEDVAAACTAVTLLDSGRRVFQGTPEQLIAAGDPDVGGDTPVERGYTTVLRAYRAAS